MSAECRRVYVAEKRQSLRGLCLWAPPGTLPSAMLVACVVVMMVAPWLSLNPSSLKTSFRIKPIIWINWMTAACVTDIDR